LILEDVRECEQSDPGQIGLVVVALLGVRPVPVRESLPRGIRVGRVGTAVQGTPVLVACLGGNVWEKMFSGKLRLEPKSPRTRALTDTRVHGACACC
jgi:hypothetical protein